MITLAKPRVVSLIIGKSVGKFRGIKNQRLAIAGSALTGR
jgi:hypothetical protein